MPEIIFPTDIQPSVSHLDVTGGAGMVPVIIMKRGSEGEMGCSEFTIKEPLRAFAEICCKPSAEVCNCQTSNL